MAKKTKKRINCKVPIITTLVFIVCLSIIIWPELLTFLMFDRIGIWKGELWRIFTCHLVHFSILHLSYNLFVFVVSGYIIEKNCYGNFGWLLICMALAISITLFILEPDMAYYGGLSGIACGSLYYCALMSVKKDWTWKSIHLLIIIFIPIKIAVEIYNKTSIMPYLERQSFVPMHASHIVGCFVAILFFIYSFKCINSYNQTLFAGEKDIIIS